jgi:dinuclear metal center YbgI/SA1388 family protein
VRLIRVVEALERIAPPAFAEAWDNVGLLVAPTRARDVRRILLAIDVTGPVLAEAARLRCELVVAYHPTWFAAERRLDAADPQARVLLGAIERRIAIWSPHTALDAIDGGINDWLAGALGPGARVPIRPLPEQPRAGAGRLVTLARPASLAVLLRRLRQRLRLRHLLVATAGPGAVRRIALAAGAGGSILLDADADLALAGELRHHETLALVARGLHVVVTGHSHSERPYLAVLRRRIAAALGAGVQVGVSRADREPLRFR